MALEFVHLKFPYFTWDKLRPYLWPETSTPSKLLELSRTQSELRAANERLALALRAGRAGFFDWNMKDGVFLGSPELNELFDLAPEFSGVSVKSWASRIVVADLKQIKGAVRRCVEARWEAIDFQFQVRTRDDAPRHLACQSKIRYDGDEKPFQMTGVVIDVTRRRQAEIARLQLYDELERRVKQRTEALEWVNEELEAFACSVSHDMRKPLRAIHGFSRILLDEYGETFDEEGLRRLRIVRRTTEHMGKLIDDLLNLSCLSRSPLNREAVDMVALTRNVYENLRFRDPARDIRLTIGDLPPAFCDRVLTRHVLDQLLANAVRFTVDRATAEIDVSGSLKDGELTYAVKDNGIGFDMASAQKMFQVFKRMHAGDGFEGTGVGLAIVKRAMELQGGRTWGEGCPGKGATFYFTFPAGAVAGAASRRSR